MNIEEPDMVSFGPGFGIRAIKPVRGSSRFDWIHQRKLNFTHVNISLTKRKYMLYVYLWTLSYVSRKWAVVGCLHTFLPCFWWDIEAADSVTETEHKSTIYLHKSKHAIKYVIELWKTLMLPVECPVSLQCKPIYHWWNSQFQIFVRFDHF